MIRITAPRIWLSDRARCECPANRTSVVRRVFSGITVFALLGLGGGARAAGTAPAAPAGHPAAVPGSVSTRQPGGLAPVGAASQGGASPSAGGGPGANGSPASVRPAGASTAGNGASASANGASATAVETSVTLPSGHYLVWTEQPPAASVPEYVSGTAVTTIAVARPGRGPARLFVLDPALGRLDIVPNIGASVVVKQSDLNRYPAVAVAVMDSTGKPMDYARVQLADADKAEHSQVLTPADGGRVIFRDVPVGPMTATASRGGVGATADSEPGAIGAEPVISLTLNAASALPVTSAAAATAPHRSPGAPPAASAPASTSPGIGGTILSVLLLLAVVALVIYAVTHQDEVRRWANPLLGKLGLSAGEPETMAPDAGQGKPSRIGAAAASDPSVCPFCGAKKDPATGSCACTLVPAGVGAPAAIPSSSGSLSAGPRLITLDGPARGQIFPITSSATVGRDAANTIPLSADTAVSRKHATFTNHDGQVEVADEGSSNGTFVNGARVTRQPLQASDEIQIGHSRFRFEAS